MSRLLNAWAWTCAVLLVIIGTPVIGLLWLLTAPFDPGRYAAGRAFRLLAVLVVRLNPLWHFRATGYVVHDPRRPYVAVSNHESYADIFLICFFPWEMKWLAKDAIFKIPFMGWMMRMAGDIRIVRGRRESAVAALKACRDRLAKRVSLMIFPEGTRSRATEMLPFKDGAFRIAVEAGAPILPIAVAGTRYAMAKGSFRFRRATAVAFALEPIETTGLTLADVPALRDRVRSLIDAKRRDLIRELGTAASAPEDEDDTDETEEVDDSPIAASMTRQATPSSAER
jgi:1-acyl-sn-glycerol-3-phosphate acyltransferase